MHRPFIRLSTLCALSLIGFVALAGCGDKEADPNGLSPDEYEPVTEEELREWVDSQEVIVAPWAHEIDEDTLDAAVIEEDKLVFPDTPENQWLLELGEHAIIHGFSEEHMVMVLDRVESVEQTDEGIVFNTRVADITELYLKLTSGAEIPDTKSQQKQHPLNIPSDHPLVETRSEYGVDLSQRNSELKGSWAFNDVPMDRQEVGAQVGYCGEASDSGGLEWKSCHESVSVSSAFNIINAEFTPKAGDSGDEEDPEGWDFTDSYSAGVLAQRSISKGYSLRNGSVAIDIDLWESSVEQGAVCVLSMYHLMDMISDRTQEVIAEYDIENDGTRSLVSLNERLNEDEFISTYAAGLSMSCKSHNKRLYDFNTWKRRFINSSAAGAARGNQDDVVTHDYHNIWRSQVDERVRAIRGSQKGFHLTGTLEFEIANPLTEVALFYKMAGSVKRNLFQWPRGEKIDQVNPLVKIEVPVPAGPFTAVVGLEVPFEIVLELAGKVGMRWEGDNAAKLAIGMDLDIGWEPGEGFSYNGFFRNTSQFYGLPELFGGFELSLTASVPVKLFFRLWRSIGPYITLEPSATLGAKLENTVGAEGTDLVCETYFTAGLKATVGGSIHAPVVGEIGNLSGLLADTCDPDNREALLPLAAREALNTLCIDMRRDYCQQATKSVRLKLNGNPDIGDKGNAPQDTVDIADIYVLRAEDEQIMRPEAVYLDDEEESDGDALEHFKRVQQPEFICDANPDWEQHVVSFEERLRVDFPETLEIGDEVVIERVDEAVSGDDGDLFECATGGEFTLAVGDGTNWGTESFNATLSTGRWTISESCGGSKETRGSQYEICGVH